MIHRPSKTLRVGDCCADIQDEVGLIAEYTRGLTAEDFVADTIDAHKTRDSVVKNTVDIGEAANNIMQLAPEVEQRIWNTVIRYLPALRTCVAEELSADSGGGT